MTLLEHRSTVSVTVSVQFEPYPPHGRIRPLTCEKTTVSTLTVSNTPLKVLTCGYATVQPVPPTGGVPAPHGRNSPAARGAPAGQLADRTYTATGEPA
jgi:hypothetical protein